MEPAPLNGLKVEREGVSPGAKKAWSKTHAPGFEPVHNRFVAP
jgi:hypothetical protein